MSLLDSITLFFDVLSALLGFAGIILMLVVAKKLFGSSPRQMSRRWGARTIAWLIRAALYVGIVLYGIVLVTALVFHPVCGVLANQLETVLSAQDPLSAALHPALVLILLYLFTRFTAPNSAYTAVFRNMLLFSGLTVGMRWVAIPLVCGV